MILARAAFASGAIFTAALIASLIRRRRYHSFRAWWNAEGCVVWILAAMIGGGLLLAQ